MLSAKCLIICGALFAFISVAAGAFGAHALKGKLEIQQLAIFETAAKYLMYHALAICFVGILSLSTSSNFLLLSGSLLIAGTILFSGSLFLLVFSNVKIFGAVTPIGGLFLLGGWLCLAYGSYQSL